MKKIVVILGFGLSVAFCVGIVKPSYKPTKGEVWPKPQSEHKESIFYSFHPNQFRVRLTGHNCSILKKAIERYSFYYMDLYKLIRRYRIQTRRAHGSNSTNQFWFNATNENNDQYRGYLKQLNIDVKRPCEEYPYFGMDESYTLNVSRTANLVSNTVWGALRGLETFAQLIYVTEDWKKSFANNTKKKIKVLRLNKTTIVDYPRSTHRGILLDTSRHFIYLNNILSMIDGMAINKMNVFHWHIVDDQSFPYQSDKFPDLSAKGAYHPSMVYTRKDIEMVIDFARDRGIRVIPEFDVPAHTGSWGKAFPQLLTECSQTYIRGYETYQGLMNPINDTTYEFLKELFLEVQSLFKDKYFHLGGDEVELECWSSNKEIQSFMTQHNFSIDEVKQLEAHFMQNALTLLVNGSRPIVWEAIQSGHQVLYSSSWYLDKLGVNFKDFYIADPWQLVTDYSNETLAKGVVGGEACMWTERVDNENFLSTIWPRASATAEKLWSTIKTNTTREERMKIVERMKTEERMETLYSTTREERMGTSYSVSNHTMSRIQEHICRMIRRRILHQPWADPEHCSAAIFTLN